ncbi:hypothetical protein MACH24_29590 [Erythrobacter sp. Dej080120_24]|nr:hypothetical protein MACH24_29590 [Erythrobacter sp. Dej080120_24]
MPSRFTLIAIPVSAVLRLIVPVRGLLAERSVMAAAISTRVHGASTCGAANALTVRTIATTLHETLDQRRGSLHDSAHNDR